MTEDEARQEAIRLGALEPQGLLESTSANFMGNARGQRWEDTQLAQRRLELWTQALLNGKDPKKDEI